MTDEQVIEWLERTRPEAETSRQWDIDHIHMRLFQGSADALSAPLFDIGFDVLVLCADDVEAREDFPGLTVIRMPSKDISTAPPTEEHIAQVHATAKRVVAHLEAGDRVLVTCRGGFNRSGFVTAVALHYRYGWEGNECVRLVRQQRDFALHNEQFARYIRTLRSTKT